MKISEESISLRGEHYGMVSIVYDTDSQYYQKSVEIPMPVETLLVSALHTHVNSESGAIVAITTPATTYSPPLSNAQFQISMEEYNQINSLKMAYSTLKEYYAQSKPKPIEEPNRPITNSILELEI